MLQQFISLQRGRIHHRLPECIIIDSELKEGQNEERWWTHHWGLVRQNMRASYPEVSDQVIDGSIHDLYRAHHHDMHDRRGSYVFEDIYPADFDIAYGVDVTLPHYQEMNELRRIIFGEPQYEPMGYEISLEALRDYAVSLTRLGTINFRFRGPGLPGDHNYMIRMVYFDPQPNCSSGQDNEDLPPVRSIVAAVANIPWNDNERSRGDGASA